MNTTNLKFFGGGKFLLALATVVFVLAACKVEDAGATTDDGSSNPPPVTPTTYTITVEANTGSLGSFKSKIVNNGDKLPALVGDQLPSKNDYEIAYWSTSPDIFSDRFEFDKSQITKDTTIYPHWRLTLNTVKTMLAGDWLQFLGNATTSSRLVKVNATQSYVSICTPDQTGPDFVINLADQANKSKLDVIKSIQIDLGLSAGTHQSINGSYYDITSAGKGILQVTINGLDFSPFCIYGGTAYKYDLNSYLAPNSTDILMDNFGDYVAADGITLKNYSATQFNITIANGDTRKGDYRFARVN